MNDDLVKRLRDISNSDSNIKSNYIGLTMMQAADAIEELSRVAEVNAKRAMFWAAQAEKYNWISVTERLPEPYVPVIVALPGKEVYEAFRVYSDKEDGEWTFYVEALHDWRRAIAWMPLPPAPELPEEEET